MCIYCTQKEEVMKGKKIEVAEREIRIWDEGSIKTTLVLTIEWDF